MMKPTDSNSAPPKTPIRVALVEDQRDTRESWSRLISSLPDVLSGGAPMTSEIARHVVASFRRKSGGLDPSIFLTARGEETLVLLSKGYCSAFGTSLTV